LTGGTLTLQTAFTEVLAQGPPAFRWAITGGTGAYRGARGECRSTFVNDHDDAAVTCTILLGP